MQFTFSQAETWFILDHDVEQHISFWGYSPRNISSQFHELTPIDYIRWSWNIVEISPGCGAAHTILRLQSTE